MKNGNSSEQEAADSRPMHIAHLANIIWHFTQMFQLVLSVSFQ